MNAGIEYLCFRKKEFKATTDSKHSKTIAKNYLNRDFIPKRANKYWVADISLSTPRKTDYTWPPYWISIPSRSLVVNYRNKQGIDYLNTRYAIKTEQILFLTSFAFK